MHKKTQTLSSLDYDHHWDHLKIILLDIVFWYFKLQKKQIFLVILQVEQTSLFLCFSHPNHPGEFGWKFIGFRKAEWKDNYI